MTLQANIIREAEICPTEGGYIVQPFDTDNVTKLEVLNCNFGSIVSLRYFGAARYIIRVESFNVTVDGVSRQHCRIIGYRSGGVIPDAMEYQGLGVTYAFLMSSGAYITNSFLGLGTIFAKVTGSYYAGHIKYIPYAYGYGNYIDLVRYRMSVATTGVTTCKAGSGVLTSLNALLASAKPQRNSPFNLLVSARLVGLSTSSLTDYSDNMILRISITVINNTYAIKGFRLRNNNGTSNNVPICPSPNTMSARSAGGTFASGATSVVTADRATSIGTPTSGSNTGTMPTVLSTGGTSTVTNTYNIGYVTGTFVISFIFTINSQGLITNISVSITTSVGSVTDTRVVGLYKTEG